MEEQEVVGVTVKQNLSHMELPLCSAAVKSFSKKYLLQKYFLCSSLAE
jgi:hypothetical protein